MKPNAVTRSAKFQVVIPQRTRETLRLRPGERFHVVNYAGRVELIRGKTMRETRGCRRGMNSRIHRDENCA